tara:strand:+ start:100 stop:774 length:675 start_codon:yes stop_codon:yes gene_type:complete
MFIYFAGSSPAFASFNLDIDDDGKTDALTDGLLILRYMFGLSGETLTVGVVGNDAERPDSDQIVTYLVTNNDQLDIDGNGSVDALTDGLLILRELFGLSNSSLVIGVIANNATRITSSSIVEFMSTIKDSDNDNTNDAFDAFPLNPSEWIDTDSDGIGNNTDTDDDNDGLSDTIEIASGSNPLIPNKCFGPEGQLIIFKGSAKPSLKCSVLQKAGAAAVSAATL